MPERIIKSLVDDFDPTWMDSHNQVRAAAEASGAAEQEILGIIFPFDAGEGDKSFVFFVGNGPIDDIQLWRGG
jgi:hypothetical protein